MAARAGAPPARDARAALLAHLKRLPKASREEALTILRADTPAPSASGRELLDWEELDRMAGAGVDVESHGATHAILTGLSDAEMDRELRAARDRLCERGHGRQHLVAYPSGAHDARVLRKAREVGYRAAFTTIRGLVGAAQDPMALPRLGVHEDISRRRADFLLRVPGFA